MRDVIGKEVDTKLVDALHTINFQPHQDRNFKIAGVHIEYRGDDREETKISLYDAPNGTRYGVFHIESQRESKFAMETILRYQILSEDGSYTPANFAQDVRDIKRRGNNPTAAELLELFSTLL